MGSISNFFVALIKAIRAFFKSDVSLKRDDGRLHVVFDEKAPAARKRRGGSGSIDPKVERDRLEAQRMQLALAGLLAETPSARAAMRHLAFFEQALTKKGLRAFQKVPYEVLQQALTQLEALVVNWSDESLACLRSKMAVAVIEREVEKTRTEEHHTTAVIEPAPLAHPVALEGDAAAEAEAALLAAYGSAALPGLDLSAPVDATEPSEADGPAAVDLQGELASPSARALAKAKGRSERDGKVDLRLRELQH